MFRISYIAVLIMMNRLKKSAKEPFIDFTDPIIRIDRNFLPLNHSASMYIEP